MLEHFDAWSAPRSKALGNEAERSRRSGNVRRNCHLLKFTSPECLMTRLHEIKRSSRARPRTFPAPISQILQLFCSRCHNFARFSWANLCPFSEKSRNEPPNQVQYCVQLIRYHPPQPRLSPETFPSSTLSSLGICARPYVYARRVCWVRIRVE